VGCAHHSRSLLSSADIQYIVFWLYVFVRLLVNTVSSLTELLVDQVLSDDLAVLATRKSVFNLAAWTLGSH
jgi:hypothetical protein